MYSDSGDLFVWMEESIHFFFHSAQWLNGKKNPSMANFSLHCGTVPVRWDSCTYKIFEDWNPEEARKEILSGPHRRQIIGTKVNIFYFSGALKLNYRRHYFKMCYDIFAAVMYLIFLFFLPKEKKMIRVVF